MINPVFCVSGCWTIDALYDAQEKAKEETIDWAKALRPEMDGRSLEALTSGFDEGWRQCLVFLKERDCLKTF